MAATQTEGMVAVVRGAGEAGVAVTLLNGNKQYTLTPTDNSKPSPTAHQRAVNPQIPQNYQGTHVRNPPILQAPFYAQQQQPQYNYTYPYQYQGPMVPIGNKVNAGMVTDQKKMVKCDSAVQACDGRYTSTYRRHHCHVSPTSPEPLPTEFPAQKPNLRPGTGHFVVGGSGSGQTAQTPTKSTEFRGGPMTWPDRGAVCCPRPRNHPDAFVSSLRKYPLDNLSPDRSSEIVERLINYTQTKNTSGKTHCNSTSRISNLEAFNLRKSLFSTQNYGQTKNIYEEFRARSPSRSPTRRSFVEEGFGNDRRTRNDDRPYIGFNRNPDVRFKLNLCPKRRVTVPTQRNNKESITNQATDTDPTHGGPATSKNKRPVPVLLDVVEEIETETVQTIQSTASYTDLSHNLPGHSVRRTKSFEVILTDSAEKFRREILGCFQGISLIPSRDPKERLLRQGLLKKLTRKLNKLCEIYKSRYKQDKVPTIEDSHEYPAPRIPVVCDKNNFGATLRTTIEPSISVTKRHDTKVYLVEVPESSRAFNSFSTEFNKTVAVWLDSIEMFAQRQERQTILNHFLTRLKMVFADRPPSNTEFREMLKAEIIYLLDCVPLSTEINRESNKYRYAEILLDKLLPTPSMEIGETKYDELQVHERELKRIVSAELGCFLQDMRVEVYDHSYLEYVKKDLYEILCDALNNIFTGSTEEIHTDLVIFLQESLSVTELLAEEMAQSMIASIRNVKTKDKSLSKVKSDSLLTKTSGNFLVYVSRSQDKFGGPTNRTDSKVSIFEPSRDISNDTQGNILQYQNDVSIQIDEWLDNLQISNIPNKTQAVNELAADIVDRKRYLELNLSAKPPDNDIDYLKYQIFKWINKSVVDNNQETIANASGLMKRIQSIPVPDLESPNQSTASNSSRRNSIQQNKKACLQCCSKRDSKESDASPENDSERIENMLLGWLTATPLYRNRGEEQRDEQELVIKKLAQTIGKFKKTSDLSKSDAELSMVNMIIQHIKALPLDNGKHFCCMRSSIVEATARNLNECLENGIFSPSTADKFSVSDQFLRNTIEDWIRGLPFEPFKNEAQAQSFRARKEDFIQRLKNSRTACCSRKKIVADIESFLMFMPFDCGKKCDPRFLNSEIIKLLQMLEVVPLEEVELLGGGGYDSFMSGLGPTSSKDDFGSMTSNRSGVTFNTMPSHIRDMIDNWAQRLPIKADTPQEKAQVDKARKAITKELVRQIEKLANDPRAIADRFFLEDMLEPILDKLLDSLPQSPELEKVRHAKKVALMQAIGDYFATLKQKLSFKMAAMEQSKKAVENWVDSLPIPPESKGETAKKINSVVAKVLNNPDLRDNPAMLDKILDQEIDNILDSLPQTPELRAQRVQLKQKLKKDLGKTIENAQADQILDKYKDSLSDAISSVIPNDNPSYKANKQKLLDVMIDINNPFATPEEKREALHKLDKLIDDMRAASPTLMAQPREEVKQRIMDALNEVPPPDKRAIGILKKRRGSLSAPQMQSLEDSLSKILPYSTSQRQAMEELGLENLVDDYVNRNYKGNNEIEKLAYKEALLDKIVKVLEDIARQGLSMDMNSLKGTILDAMKTVPLPNEPGSRKKNALKNELSKWMQDLPITTGKTPAERAQIEKYLDDLADKIIQAEEQGGPGAARNVIIDWLQNAPFINKKRLNPQEAVTKLLDGIANSDDYQFAAAEQGLRSGQSGMRANKKKILQRELGEWFDNLPKSMADTPANRARVNKLLDDLTEKIIDAEDKHGSLSNSKSARKDILKDFLNNAPFIKKKQINMDDAANSLIERIDTNMAYITPDASQASTLGSYGSAYGPKAPSMAEQEKERTYRSNIKDDIAKALPIPVDNPHVAKAMDSLIDAYIDSQIDDSSPLKKKEAMRRLDKLVDELYEANPSLKSQSREAVKKKIMDALKKQSLPDKEGLKKVLQHKVNSSDNYRDKLKQQIRNSLPPHKLGSAVKEAEFEMLLDDIVDNTLKMQHQGTGEAQKAVFKQKMDNSMNKLLGLVEKSGVKLSPDIKNNIFTAINEVPTPDDDKLREHQKEVILKEEIADWVNKLPLKPTETPDEILERNREIEGLVQKIIEAEKNAGPYGNPEELKKNVILKWLKHCPFLIKSSMNPEKSADDLLNRIKNNQAYQSPDAPLSIGAAVSTSKTATLTKIPEQFRKAADELNTTVADWCDEIPLPADLSPTEREEAKLKAREAGNKLVSKINEVLTDPKMRDDSFLFQSIAENEIDNMFDSLPQTPELQAKKEELKKNLMKKFHDIREKAKGEHVVHDYGSKISDAIANILPSQYDNPDIAAAKERLADTFKELMFEPLSPSQKKKVLKKFNALVDEIYDATPSLHNQPKEQVRRRLLNALKKIPPPPKKFMANELAECKLKREVSDLFHDLKVRPQSREDKEHINKIKSALAKVLHDIENRIPPDSEEYDKQIKDALHKWAHKLQLTSDQESQLPCLIGKFVEKLKTSNRKRRDDLAAHLNDEDESASDEEESVCWKCKQKITCRRPPSVPCMRPSNFYIPPQCYMPPPDCYRPPPQQCFKPPDCYTPLPDCFKPSEYKKPIESHKAREYSRPPEANRQLDCNKPRECFRQPEIGRHPRPHPAQTRKTAKFPNCRRTNSPMATMNPHNCYYSSPPLCPRCYALGHPCNEHRY